jgi:transposase InsO family protein
LTARCSFHRFQSGTPPSAWRSGLDGLRPASRLVGNALVLTSERRELLLDIRREHPGASAKLILDTLVADGRLPANVISLPTLARLYRAHGLDRATLRRTGCGKVRLRWQAERPNALWHGDVCHAQVLVTDGKRLPLRIHALLDDASRYVVALEAHSTETEMDMLHLLVAALGRQGVPDALYLDNGSTYRGDALRVACERLGITLLHPSAGDPQARGKIERFWRRLREQCLDFLGSLASLHDVNVRLAAYLDHQYHATPHGGLLGKTPAQVWLASDRDRHADPVTSERLRRALTVTERRRVRNDSTISVAGRLWQLDQGFLAGRIVTVERYLLDATEAPTLLFDGRRYPTFAVDPVANARLKRTRIEPPAATGVPFDPPGALLDRAAGRPPRHRRRREDNV